MCLLNPSLDLKSTPEHKSTPTQKTSTSTSTSNPPPKKMSSLSRLHSIAAALRAENTATKCVDSPVLAKLGPIERYKHIMGKEPLIQGLWPAFITPLTKGGEVDVAAVKPLCDYLIDVCGVHGLYACGGTGEMRSLTVEQRKEMCAATCAAVAGR